MCKGRSDNRIYEVHSGLVPRVRGRVGTIHRAAENVSLLGKRTSAKFDCRKPGFRHKLFWATRSAPVRRAKPAVRVYRLGGPTYNAAARLLGEVDSRYASSASSSSYGQNIRDRLSSKPTLNAGKCTPP